MSDTAPAIEQVTAEDAARMIDEGAFLLDVREPDEWQAGHAPSASHLPLAQLAAGHEGLLPRDNRIVAVCRAGGRSQRAAVALVEAGYDVVNLAGGMQAWAAAGQPVVTDAGDDGQVI